MERWATPQRETRLRAESVSCGLITSYSEGQINKDVFPVSRFFDEKNRRGSGSSSRRLFREAVRLPCTVLVPYTRSVFLRPYQEKPSLFHWSVSHFQMPGVLKLSLWSRVRKGHVVFVKITAFCIRACDISTFPWHVCHISFKIKIMTLVYMFIYIYCISFCCRLFCFVFLDWGLVSLSHICGKMTYSTKMSPAGRNNMLKK